jgi:hypothetical protein
MLRQLEKLKDKQMNKTKKIDKKQLKLKEVQANL